MCAPLITCGGAPFSIFNFQFSVFNILEIIGAVIGLAYIISEYRADRFFWPLSILMSLFYIVIDFTSGIYANGAICCYNLLMSIYGLLVWRGIVQSKERAERPVGSCPRHYWPFIGAAVAVLSVVLWWLLGTLGESQFPWLDGISSALSIVAMWMLSQKYWQQWILWLVVEPLMILLFYITGNYASALLYVVFEVFCVLGIIRWRRLERRTSAGV
ncbi:MAG: nicotinamide mononucleotide transporter [Bacteroidales bacterium]|nr:nicotinamide mononucleotide transporter [Bacteroidales bacterium]